MLRSDRIRVVPGHDGWPAAWDYVVGSRSVRFEAGESASSLLHLMLPHPLDDHYGLSAIEAAAAAIDIHNEASRWNKAFLDNAARPSGALVYAADGANLSEEQFLRLKGELEQGFQGAANAGRPLLLEGGLDWKPLSLSPKDMDFVELKNVAAREIALACGVPPLVLGLAGDNTHANYAEANRAFWRHCVAPLVHKIAQELALWLSQHFGASLSLTPDFDGVEAMSAIREPLWRAVAAAGFPHRGREAGGAWLRPRAPAGGRREGEQHEGRNGDQPMNAITEDLVQRFFAHADIGHLALLIWASGASALVAFCIREAAEAARRAESFMQDFLQELSRFNRHHQEEEER